MEAVSFKGIIIGGILDVVASVVLGLPFAIYSISRLDLSGIPKDQIGTAVTAAIHANIPLYVGQLLVGLACSVLGGYVAAWVAKRHELLNGVLSSFLCVLLGMYLLASGQDTNPRWLQLLLLVASPALALLGGDLMRRQRQRRWQMA